MDVILVVETVGVGQDEVDVSHARRMRINRHRRCRARATMIQALKAGSHGNRATSSWSTRRIEKEPIVLPPRSRLQ